MPDIHQEVRQQDTQNNELRLPDNADAIEMEPPWTQPVELSESDGKEAIREDFTNKGIGYDDLTPKEWSEIFERLDLLDKGYEFSSKSGISIGSFYGRAAHAKEQKWSRIKQKIRNLSNKPR